MPGNRHASVASTFSGLRKRPSPLECPPTLERRCFVTGTVVTIGAGAGDDDKTKLCGEKADQDGTTQTSPAHHPLLLLWSTARITTLGLALRMHMPSAVRMETSCKCARRVGMSVMRLFVYKRELVCPRCGPTWPSYLPFNPVILSQDGNRVLYMPPDDTSTTRGSTACRRSGMACIVRW